VAVAACRTRANVAGIGGVGYPCSLPHAEAPSSRGRSSATPTAIPCSSPPTSSRLLPEPRPPLRSSLRGCRAPSRPRSQL